MSERKPIPMRPIVIAEDGVIRFQENKVVRLLVDRARERGYSLNELVRDLPEASPDWDEFYQLIGYSVSGYGDLSRVSPESVEAADTIAVKLSKTRKPKEST